MSLPSCIPGLVAGGKIRKGDGERAEKAYQRHVTRLGHSMSPEAAAAEASRLTLDQLDYENGLKRRQTVLQIEAQRRILADTARFRGDPEKAAAAVLGADAKAPYASVEAQHRAVLGRLHNRMEGVLAAHRRDLLGRARDKSGLIDLVRERFGEDTGNLSAKELANAFGDAADYARTRFNRAGGGIGKREDWGLPQSHDSLKVRAVPYETWRRDILGQGDAGAGIDLTRMIDDSTGQPFTPEGIEEALQSSYAAIRSDGWSRRRAGGAGQGKLANAHADHRFFTFKDADAWLAYHDKYGSGTPFDAMVSHVDRMARDIALMEVLGPNPKATLRWMQDWLVKSAQTGEDAAPGLAARIAGTGSVLDRARSAEKRLGDLYDVVAGQLNSPVNAVWARRMGGTRAYLTSALLGSSPLSAITDVGFQAVTRAYNGLPVTGAITGYLKLLNPFAREDRRIAVRLGLVAEEASRMAASLNRYVDGTHGPEIASRLSDAVLRISGISPWTQAGRWAFGMETLGHLADVRGQAYGALAPAVRDMLGRYGIDAAGWDHIRATETYKYGGAEFLRPDDVADEQLGDAMLRMVLTETDYAVPAATARSRAALSFGQRPGTWAGEIIRNGALFKSFGVSMLMTHGARMMEGGAWSRVKYFSGLAITTTLLGALTLQLRALSQGKDPEPTHSASFWWRAGLQGGGAGIFGDFLQSASNRFGGGPAETLSGPVVGLGGDLARSTNRMVSDAVDPNRDVNPGREAIGLAARYTPGGSLWYARLAYNRFVLDQLQRQIDPAYDQHFDRQEQNAANQGQAFWWHPGEGAPERAPNVGRAPE